LGWKRRTGAGPPFQISALTDGIPAIDRDRLTDDHA
jgi:hypothetical protein